MVDRIAELWDINTEELISNYMIWSDAKMTFEEYQKALCSKYTWRTETRRKKILQAFEYANKNPRPNDPYKEIRLAHWIKS